MKNLVGFFFLEDHGLKSTASSKKNLFYVLMQFSQEVKLGYEQEKLDIKQEKSNAIA